MYQSLEGETVTVYTRDGREYTGLIAAASHSPHVFDDARSMPRDEHNMVVMLDMPVKNKADVKALGIANGDFISPEPRTYVTENGYLKSRFIDDKGAIACCFAALKHIADNKLTPSRDIIFAFPYYEEKSCGGAYVPDGIEEYVAVDIAILGPDSEGSENAVTICAKDASLPYDYDLTNRLISAAERVGCEYAIDLFYRYGSDAGQAFRGGNNVRVAAFGMGVYSSHGVERVHITGVEHTARLMLAYILGV